MTTVPPEELSARDVLKEYKGQVHVERHFHFLKDPLFVGALYVKKPKRVEALGYVLLLACLLYSLLERRLRDGAKWSVCQKFSTQPSWPSWRPFTSQ